MDLGNQQTFRQTSFFFEKEREIFVTGIVKKSGKNFPIIPSFLPGNEILIVV